MWEQGLVTFLRVYPRTLLHMCRTRTGGTPGPAGEGWRDPKLNTGYFFLWVGPSDNRTPGRSRVFTMFLVLRWTDDNKTVQYTVGQESLLQRTWVMWVRLDSVRPFRRIAPSRFPTRKAPTSDPPVTEGK